MAARAAAVLLAAACTLLVDGMSAWRAGVQNRNGRFIFSHRRTRYTGSAMAGIDYNEDTDSEEFKEPAPVTLREMCASLKVPENFLKKIPPAQKRQDGSVEADSSGFKAMRRLYRRLTNEMAALVYPGNPAAMQDGADPPDLQLTAAQGNKLLSMC